ncbi:MAG: rhomboid family intramembrane serine protease [Bacteroidia bacterium]
MKNYLSKKLFAISFYPMVFVSILWLVYGVSEAFSISLSWLGVLPRDIKGLPGIVCSVFIHGGLDHIASNSVPLLVLGMLLFFFYKRIAIPAFFWIWIISGVWLWIGGRNHDHFPVYHIGASTLVYGLAFFLFFSGVFRRHLRLMVVSALVVFLYGSIMWGMFPIKQEISWEGHLFGAIAGLLVAFNYRKDGPQMKKYDWENEEDNDVEIHNDIEEARIISINYVLKKNEETEGNDLPDK